MSIRTRGGDGLARMSIEKRRSKKGGEVDEMTAVDVRSEGVHLSAKNSDLIIRAHCCCNYRIRIVIAT